MFLLFRSEYRFYYDYDCDYDRSKRSRKEEERCVCEIDSIRSDQIRSAMSMS